MNLFTAILLGVVPALFVAAAFVSMIKKPLEKKNQRWLAWALLACVVLIPLIGLVAQTAVVAFIMAPPAIGLLALVWTNFEIKPRQRVWWLLGGLVTGLIVGISFYRSEAGSLAILLGNALVLGSAWVAVRKGWGKAAALALAAVFLFLLSSDTWIRTTLPEMPRFIGVPLGVLHYLLPGWVTALAAFLIAAGLRNTEKASWWKAVLQVGLALGLLAWLGWVIYWNTAWDLTSDGLGGIMLAFPGALTAVAAGMFLAVKAPLERESWRWVLGAVYGVSVPLFLFLAFYRGWDFDYQAVTRQRAAQVAQALEDYQAQQGSYPAELDELTPGTLRTIPQPFILRGESWCYQSWQGGYRLGALWREYFSLPLEVKVYASQGEPPEGEWECDLRLAEMLEEYGVYGP
jgi:hypothetical protein